MQDDLLFLLWRDPFSTEGHKRHPASGRRGAFQPRRSVVSWTRDDRMMIACCNDGTRPVIFKIERIDPPETEEERRWLAAQHFENSPQDAYTG